MNAQGVTRVWVDCTAAAHPLVLRPVVESLRAGGIEVLITTREYGQTVGILERLGLDYVAVGSHGGAGWRGKATALAGRSRGLARLIWKWRPELALAHGSVDLALVAATLRISSVQMQDYEFAGLQRKIAFRLARRVLVPDSIPVERMKAIGAPERKLFRYPGLKEDYYLADFRPEPGVLSELGLDRDQVIVVLRPPPETSEYHAPNAVFDQVLTRLASEPGMQTVLIPRTERQGEAARALADGGGAGRLIVPERAIDAQSLIAFSDLVVSAGGTMNREAVALGVPVYTTFAGRMGGVDEALIAAGRLRVLDSPDALELSKRESSPGPVQPRDPSLLVQAILSPPTRYTTPN